LLGRPLLALHYTLGTKNPDGIYGPEAEADVLVKCVGSGPVKGKERIPRGNLLFVVESDQFGQTHRRGGCIPRRIADFVKESCFISDCRRRRFRSASLLPVIRDPGRGNWEAAIRRLGS